MSPVVGDPIRHETHDRPTALILGNYVASLAVVRALGAAGYRVVAGDGGEYATVRYSRHCREIWKHPPIHQGDDFLAALVAHLERRQDIGVLVPLQQDYVAALAAHRSALPARLVVASPDPATVVACLDKDRMYRLAAEAGVLHHPVKRAEDFTELVAGCDEVGYPCVVRPMSDAGARLPQQRKALICRDRAGLLATLSAWPAGHDGLLIQRYVSGSRHNVFFASRTGTVLAQVHTRILRTDRIDGTGLAVEGITVAPDPRLARACAALVERLGYTGIGFAQFLVPDTGEPHFLELNPRHAGSAAISDHCGLDLTAAAISLAQDDQRWRVAGEFRYPAGQRYVWTSRDLYSAALALLRSEVGLRGALAWVGQAAWAAIRADVHLTWTRRDPLPSLAVWAHLLTLGPVRRMRRARSEEVATG